MNSVVIVGRPNVGKSSLFNRLAGHRRSIVHNRPGVTRDSIYARVEIDGRPVCLVDTGGFVPGENSTDMEQLVVQQVRRNLEEADLLLIVFDAREGLTPSDEEIVRQLRIMGKPMIAAVNKVDPDSKVYSGEFTHLGIKSQVEISAEHGKGFDDLKSEILIHLPAEPRKGLGKISKDAIQIAFVGRPNVGKSSLINQILREPRLIVSEQPGTTRDVVDTYLEKDRRKFVLLDTAGIRRKLKITDSVEHFSAVRSLKAMEQADVVVLVVDALERVTTQDERIASAVLARGAGLLLIVNKWDLMKEHKNTRFQYRDDVHAFSPFLSFAALKFASAKTGMGVDQILNEAWRISHRRSRSFSKEELEMAFQSVEGKHTVGGGAGMRLKLFDLTQAQGEKVSTFFVWCNDPRWIPSDYERYWTNAIQKSLRLEGVPIRVVFRRKKKARVH